MTATHPKLLITGGTGLIGNQLQKVLRKNGYEICLLTTQKKIVDQKYIFYWNPSNHEIDSLCMQGVSCIINLAGTNIGDKRWTATNKRSILTSRTRSIELLKNTIQTHAYPIETFISASAIGYYGALTSEQIFTEETTAAHDFLGNTCKQWEDAADTLSTLGIRVVKLRTGIVLSTKGGVLEKISATLKYGFISGLGSGKQYMPWIHIDDLCNMYNFCLENSTIRGSYNAVTPEHLTHNEFIQILAKSSRNKLILPNIPSFLIKLLLGEMADLVLTGSRVSSEKIQQAGFHFKYPELASALKHI